MPVIPPLLPKPATVRAFLFLEVWPARWRSRVLAGARGCSRVLAGARGCSLAHAGVAGVAGELHGSLAFAGELHGSLTLAVRCLLSALSTS
jgi:hypothetical protein